jgi:hypothetical protein
MHYFPALLALCGVALALPLERDEPSDDQLGECEVWEYHGQISLLADDVGVCLTVVGDSAESGKPISV